MLSQVYTKNPSRYGPKSTEKPKKSEIGDDTHVAFSRGAGGPKNHVFAYFEWWSMSHPKNFMLFFTHYGRSSNPENFSVLAHLFAWETGGYPLAEQNPPNFQFLGCASQSSWARPKTFWIFNVHYDTKLLRHKRENSGKIGFTICLWHRGTLC